MKEVRIRCGFCNGVQAVPEEKLGDHVTCQQCGEQTATSLLVPVEKVPSSKAVAVTVALLLGIVLLIKGFEMLKQDREPKNPVHIPIREGSIEDDLLEDNFKGEAKLRPPQQAVPNNHQY